MYLAAGGEGITTLTGVVTLICGLLAGGAGLLTSFAQRGRGVVESYKDLNADIRQERNDYRARTQELEKSVVEKDQAIDRYRRILWQYGVDPERALNNIAVALEAIGKFEDALAAYQAALKVDPANVELKRNYGRFSEFYQSFKTKPKADAPLMPTKPPGAP